MIRLLGSEIELSRGSFSGISDDASEMVTGLFPTYRVSTAQGYLSRRNKESVLCLYCGQWGVGLSLYSYSYISSRYVEKDYYLIKSSEIPVFLARVIRTYGKSIDSDKFNKLIEKARVRCERKCQ